MLPAVLIGFAVLSGPGAPAAITAEQNSSSNCWPIEPKSYELTPVTTISTTVCQSLFGTTR